MSARLIEGAADQINFKTAHFIIKVNAASHVYARRSTGAFAHDRACCLWIGDFRPQAFARDLIAGGDHDRAFDGVFQLTYVTGP